MKMIKATRPRCTNCNNTFSAEMRIDIASCGHSFCVNCIRIAEKSFDFGKKKCRKCNAIIAESNPNYALESFIAEVARAEEETEYSVSLEVSALINQVEQQEEERRAAPESRPKRKIQHTASRDASTTDDESTSDEDDVEPNGGLAKRSCVSSSSTTNMGPELLSPASLSAKIGADSTTNASSQISSSGNLLKGRILKRGGKLFIQK